MDGLGWDVATGLFLVSVIAGFVDAIAGGGGLLTVPALLAAGITPVQVLATNKLQGSFGSFSASLHFVRQGYASPRAIWPAILCTFIGAAAGAILVQWLDAKILNGIIPLLLVIAALYFLFSPRMTDIGSTQRLGLPLFALLCGTTIGFYDGFFGPGTGSYFVLAFVALLGYGVKSATAHTKVLNFTSNAASLLFFILGGHVVWSIGLLMGAGQFMGAKAGAHVVIGAGAKVVRPVLVLISLAITTHLVLKNFDVDLLRYLGNRHVLG
jgi:uncharacterized membrane protein YfcA